MLRLPSTPSLFVPRLDLGFKDQLYTVMSQAYHGWTGVCQCSGSHMLPLGSLLFCKHSTKIWHRKGWIWLFHAVRIYLITQYSIHLESEVGTLILPCNRCALANEPQMLSPSTWAPIGPYFGNCECRKMFSSFYPQCASSPVFIHFPTLCSSSQTVKGSGKWIKKTKLGTNYWRNTV